jgi:hypothetical protein
VVSDEEWNQLIPLLHYAYFNALLFYLLPLAHTQTEYMTKYYADYRAVNIYKKYIIIIVLLTYYAKDHLLQTILYAC